jgi:cell wall-associated NlpC family hydrolase
MAVSGFGVGMTAAGAFIIYVGISNQPIPDAIRNIIKGNVKPVPNKPATITGVSTPDITTPTGRQDLAGAGRKYIGRPYQWGKNFDPPNGGGDCSGLVYRAFHDLGYNTPRLVSWAYRTWPGTHIVTETPNSGDLIWYRGHIAIAVSSTQMVEAPTFGVPVRIANIRRDNGYTVLRVNWGTVASKYDTVPKGAGF